MKKLLSILAVTGIIAGTSSTVISCGEENKKNLKDFKEIKNIPAIGKKGTDLKIAIYKSLAKFANVDKETIANDKNLKITINNKNIDEFKNTDLTIKEYIIKIKATNDKYFKGEGKTIVIPKIINLAKINIIIGKYSASSRIKTWEIANVVFKQIGKLLWFTDHPMRWLWLHSADLRDNFFELIDASGKRLKKNDELTAQKYKVIVTALKHDHYFIGTKTITFEVV